MGDVKWHRATGKGMRKGLERERRKNEFDAGGSDPVEEQLVMQGEEDNCWGSP